MRKNIMRKLFVLFSVLLLAAERNIGFLEATASTRWAGMPATATT